LVVYDRVKKMLKEEIDDSKRYKQMLISAWKDKSSTKTWLIKEMLRCLKKDIQIWWMIRGLKKANYIGYRKGD